ncbi:MAG: hypothetical protein GY780_03880 [bacterium]|nr:hypothetical protein [bacterium]
MKTLIKISWVVLLGGLLWLAGCAASSHTGLENENQVFPPHSLLPLAIAMTTPLEPVIHQADHQSLQSWSSSGAQRRHLMQCVWSDGLDNLLQNMVPGTTFKSLQNQRNPLVAVGCGVETTTDTLGIVHFELVSKSVIDVARHQKWTHMVVPLHLNYQIEENENTLWLQTQVAIIDVQESRIVWQGTLDSRNTPAGKLGSRKEQQPALTAFEEVTYCYVLDLMKILNRQLNQGLENRNDLASPCQNRPSLLDEINDHN